MPLTYLGNTDFLSLRKIGFFCSRHYDAQSILHCMDWAKVVDKQCCIVSTFHSPLEQDVLKILLLRHVPVIMVLGRAMYKKVPKKYQPLLEEGKLLLVSPFDEKCLRAENESYFWANNYILTIADEIVVGHAAPRSGTERLLTDAEHTQTIKQIIKLYQE